MRKLEGFYKYVAYILGIAMVLYTVSSITVYTVDPWLLNATHLTFALVLLFWLVPMKKNAKTKKETRPAVSDLILSSISLASLIYLYIEFKELIYRAGTMPTTYDIVFGALTILVVLEASRRSAGLGFTLVVLGAIAYTLFGASLPGILGHNNFTFSRTVSYIFSGEGIYGSTLKASASFAILYITLGAFFQAFGAADFFNNFAMAVSGDKRGGPGKVAVVASGLFGMISGHSAGNVATTGTFTIPMMKKIGYKPSFAGGVEANVIKLSLHKM